MGGPLQLDPFGDTIRSGVGARLGRGVFVLAVVGGLALGVIGGFGRSWFLVGLGAVVAVAGIVGMVRRWRERRAAERIRALDVP